VNYAVYSPLLTMKPLSLLLAFGLTAAVRVVNFDNAVLGRTPPGWTVAMTSSGLPPQWEVLKDGTAPTRPYVLAQVAADPSGDRCPLAIWDAAIMRDGEISVRLKPVSGKEVQAGGIVWRYRDENNYYLARVNAIDHNVQVFKIIRGVRFPMMRGVRHEFPHNEWSTLKVWMRGNRFQVYMDHRRVMQGQDDTFSTPGKVGLWTAADSVTYFDNFRIAPR
jgi:hypothetical protein